MWGDLHVGSLTPIRIQIVLEIPAKELLGNILTMLKPFREKLQSGLSWNITHNGN